MIWRGYEQRIMYDAPNVSTPTRYGVLIAIMREYGWSWQDLLNAPADLVEEVAARLAAENHWTQEKQRRDEAMNETRAALGY